jgi:hypothetical protein
MTTTTATVTRISDAPVAYVRAGTCHKIADGTRAWSGTAYDADGYIAATVSAPKRESMLEALAALAPSES